MSEKTKKILVIEIVALVLSLLPLLLIAVIPGVDAAGNILEAGTELSPELEQERMFFIISLCVYMIFPFLSLVLGVFFPFFQYEWYLAALPGPMIVFFSGVFILGLDIGSVLIFMAIYFGIGCLGALPIIAFKKRREKDDPRPKTTKVVNDRRL